MPQEITRVLLNLVSNGFYAAMKRKAEGRPANGYEPALTALSPRTSAIALKFASATTAVASPPMCGQRCSIRSSPPSRRAKARASASH